MHPDTAPDFKLTVCRCLLFCCHRSLIFAWCIRDFRDKKAGGASQFQRQFLDMEAYKTGVVRFTKHPEAHMVELMNGNFNTCNLDMHAAICDLMGYSSSYGSYVHFNHGGTYLQEQVAFVAHAAGVINQISTVDPLVPITRPASESPPPHVNVICESETVHGWSSAAPKYVNAVILRHSHLFVCLSHLSLSVVRILLHHAVAVVVSFCCNRGIILAGSLASIFCQHWLK